MWTSVGISGLSWSPTIWAGRSDRRNRAVRLSDVAEWNNKQTKHNGNENSKTKHSQTRNIQYVPTSLNSHTIFHFFFLTYSPWDIAGILIKTIRKTIIAHSFSDKMIFKSTICNKKIISVCEMTWPHWLLDWNPLNRCRCCYLKEWESELRFSFIFSIHMFWRWSIKTQTNRRTNGPR